MNKIFFHQDLLIQFLLQGLDKQTEGKIGTTGKIQRAVKGDQNDHPTVIEPAALIMRDHYDPLLLWP